MPKTTINIIKKASAPIVDAHQIVVDDNSGETSIIFLQIFPVPVGENNMEAEVVANIRLKHNQAKALCESLQKAIEDFEKKHTK